MQSYWERGLFQLSLNEVCRLAGISKPALYRAFGGEDSLMAATLAAYRERRVLPMLAYLEEERPIADALERAIVGLTTDDGTPAGCLFTKMRISGPRLGEETKRAVAALQDEHRRAFEAFFRRGLERGDANPEFSPEFAARYLDTQFASILVQIALGVAPGFVRDQARLALRALSK